MCNRFKLRDTLRATESLQGFIFRLESKHGFIGKVIVIDGSEYANTIQQRPTTVLRNCLAGQAPVYLRELCVPVSSLPGRRSLRSAEQGDLVVPRVRLATAQRRSFAVVGPPF